MKAKILFLLLVAASMGSEVLCQQTIINFPVNRQSRADLIFDNQKVGAGKKRFDFIFPRGNVMIIEISADNQVDSLPDIDSLVLSVWKDLQTIDDSLNSPLSSKRIDVVFSAEDKRIRIQEFPQKGEIYNIKDGEITQLKVEQDTLRFTMVTPRKTVIQGYLRGQPYYITFLVNHISDVPEMLRQNPPGPILNLFKNDFKNRKGSTKASASFTRYYAWYNIASGERISPVKGRLRGVGQTNRFIPYVQTGMQYLRGYWVPSAGAGMEWINKTSESLERRYRIIWEPYFIFNSDSIKSVSLQRNDFITFKYNSSSKFNSGTREVQFVQNFSLGYLVRRTGNEFNPNTFKFSLPGLQTKNILLEPEFIFNGLFKNFSPSLKLTLFLE